MIFKHTTIIFKKPILIIFVFMNVKFDREVVCVVFRYSAELFIVYSKLP